jgi:hypothetical protein
VIEIGRVNGLFANFNDGNAQAGHLIKHWANNKKTGRHNTSVIAESYDKKM